MRTLKNVPAIAIALAFLVGLPAIANATPIQFGPTGATGPGNDIAKNGTGIAGGNSNNDANNLFRLQVAVTGYNTVNFLTPLPTPIAAGALDLSSFDQSVGTPLAGFAYAVLHYGSGPNGDSSGGVEFFFLNGMTSFIFPANGTGPSGFGGFSSLTLFASAPPVPDGGTTIALLGVALAAVELLRRAVSRRAVKA